MKKSIIFSTFIFVVHITFAQVRTAYFPEGNALQEVELLKNVRKARTVQVKKTMPAFDVQPLMDEDKEMDEMGDRPFQFGKGFDTNFTLKDGIWTDVENGRLWSMQFKSDGAYSINFVFDNFIYLRMPSCMWLMQIKPCFTGLLHQNKILKTGIFLQI